MAVPMRTRDEIVRDELNRLAYVLHALVADGVEIDRDEIRHDLTDVAKQLQILSKNVPSPVPEGPDISKLQRYCFADYGGDIDGASMDPETDGEWVRFEDVQALLKRSRPQNGSDK